jgi:hypothetical protein
MQASVPPSETSEQLLARLRPLPEQLDFPPVRNGVDYLLSVVDHLYRDRVLQQGMPTPRDIKYAVLHLQAAAEVLLKARLLRDHWSLVFKDPGQASEGRFHEGDFESCGIDDTVRRLRQIAGLPITDQEQKALKDLARDRNALQHYGLTHNARAVEARAGQVLDFLVRFLDEVLLPGLTAGEEDAIGEDMARVREGLSGIQTYVTHRMNRLQGELKGERDRTLQCPECAQWTLVVTANDHRCRFCGLEMPNAHMLLLWYVRGHALNAVVGPCSRCEEPTLLSDVVLARDHTRVSFCFSCATVTDVASND